MGSYCKDGKETKCTNNTYADNTNKKCTTCGNNEYCKDGVKQLTCSGNTYPNTSTNSCDACPSNSVCTNGAKIKTCTGNTFPQDGNCVACTAGGYCQNGIRTACNDGEYALANSTSCTSCSTTTNCKLCNKETGVCTECQKGYSITVKNNKTTCEAKTGVEIFNAGDPGGLPINDIPNLTICTAGLSCSCPEGQACCWRGDTSNSHCENRYSSYNTCNRTVCNYWAAVAICDAYGMKLPSEYFLSKWSSKINQYQLCDWGSLNDYPYCDASSNCKGAFVDYCAPYVIWSSTSDGSSKMSNYRLTSGSWNYYSYYKEYAASVRCVGLNEPD